ncbi:MAG: LysM peptidoglycan-binding domain-containing protein, partial [Acidobacteria bacterium]|nr:LysM peptidoglycan-binding domain-containing protein [Acidobacteriota bacterium]
MMMKVGDSSGSGRVSDLMSRANQGQADTTSVKLGEKTLADVAGRLEISEQKLLEANPALTKAAELKAGQELTIPRPTQERMESEKPIPQEEPPMQSEAQEQRLTSRLFKGKLFRKLFSLKASQDTKQQEMSAFQPASSRGGEVAMGPEVIKTPDPFPPMAPEPFPNKLEPGTDKVIKDKVLFKGEDVADVGHGKIGIRPEDEAGVLKGIMSETDSKLGGGAAGVKSTQKKVLIDPSEIRTNPPITENGFEDPLTARPQADKGFEDPLTARPKIRHGFEDPLTARPKHQEVFE